MRTPSSLSVGSKLKSGSLATMDMLGPVSGRGLTDTTAVTSVRLLITQVLFDRRHVSDSISRVLYPALPPFTFLVANSGEPWTVVVSACSLAL